MQRLWVDLIVGYGLTVAVELPILAAGLGRAHSLGRRVVAGFWLTACTYPVVVLMLPPLLYGPIWGSRGLYLAVAELLAPVAEIALFRAAFNRTSRRDATVILAANLSSFAFGELLHWGGLW